MEFSSAAARMKTKRVSKSGMNEDKVVFFRASHQSHCAHLDKVAFFCASHRCHCAHWDIVVCFRAHQRCDCAVIVQSSCSHCAVIVHIVIKWHAFVAGYQNLCLPLEQNRGAFDLVINATLTFVFNPLLDDASK